LGSKYKIPVYVTHGTELKDPGGQVISLFWPRKMTYEQIKQFVAERERRKKEGEQK